MMLNISSRLVRTLILLIAAAALWVWAAPTVNAGGHTNLAHYTFPNTNQFTSDVSGNGNNVGLIGGTGGQYYITNASKEGPFAAFFTYDHNFASAYFDVPTNLLPTLARSFTISLWMKSSDSFGNDTDNGDFNGEGIFTTHIFGGSSNDVIPMSMTGSKLAFLTGGSPHQTLHSVASVNTGSYVHVAVTRDLSTGQKQIYVNGALDATGSGTTNLLNYPDEIRVGANFNANGFNGELDDIQIYSGVLSAAEIHQIYTNVGVTVPNASGATGTLAEAVDAPALTWTTGGSAPWIYETNVTHDGVDAAASGNITNSQLSYIQTTVPNDGTISFWWKVSSEEFDFLTFYINDDDFDENSGEVDWLHDTFPVSAGDVLRWEYAKDGSVSEGSDKGWLDQVIYTPNSAPSPVSATFKLQVYREQSPAGADVYYAFPSLSSVSPAPVTQHVVDSPTGSFTSDNGSFILSSLAAVINECTNTNGWKLHINKGDPSERIFTFTMSVSGLTTNLLQAAVATSPTNNASNVTVSTPFRWTGPSNFSSLSLVASSPTFINEGFTNLPPTATNWPSPPTLLYSGTNHFQITYISNNFPQITTSTPVDSNSVPVSNWISSAHLVSFGNTSFIVSPPPPTVLTNVQRSGGNFQFSLQTQQGRPHIIEANSNLTTTNWVVLSNFTGDGTLKQFTFPATNPPVNFFRVRTQ